MVQQPSDPLYRPPMTQTYDFVVVANRLPVAAETADDGTNTWVRSPGGLVSALEPDPATRFGGVGRLVRPLRPRPVLDRRPRHGLQPLPADAGPCPLSRSS